MRRFLGVFALLALGGCASGGMDVAECSTADWQAIGFEDGAAGQNMSAFSARRKACAEHGIAPDFNGYRAGRSEGLALYCRPANGYRVGDLGIPYSGVCPADLESAFVAAHSDGYGLYQRRAAFMAVNKRLEQKRARSRSVERLMAEKTASIASGQLPPEQLASIAVELKQLAEEKGRLYGEIHRLEVEREEADKAYRRYEARMASRASR